MAQEDGSPVTPSNMYFPRLGSPYPLLSSGLGSPYAWLGESNFEQRGLCLIKLLQGCAYNVATGNIEQANGWLEQISQLASPGGDTMQRIAAYFTEALADRMLKGLPGLYKALNSTKITSVAEEIHVKRLFFELCPFLKLSYVITNQAIVEAMEGERMVHIIDLHSFEPAQWVNLIQTLSDRPEGPPHLRITGIHEQKEVLDQMALRLIEEAEKLDIPFQFNPIVSKLENLDVESLRKTGEALAVCSALQLHSLLATDDDIARKQSPLATTNPQKNLRLNQLTLGEMLKKDPISGYGQSPDTTLSPLSFSCSPKMGNFLTALWGLSPKLLVITEQESDQNGHTLMDRIDKAMYFYAALFDCLESTVSRASLERQKLEKMLFGEEIKNIVSCEGTDRKERHENLEKWILRLESTGFGRVQLSYHGRMQANKMLRDYGYEGYVIKEEHGCLLICWHNRPLFSVSAWRFRRYD